MYKLVFCDGSIPKVPLAATSSTRLVHKTNVQMYKHIYFLDVLGRALTCHYEAVLKENQ